MKKRKLTPLTIALGLALVGNAYAANIVDGTLINSSTSFDEDTVYTDHGSKQQYGCSGGNHHRRRKDSDA